eukprot:5736532-Amphidinium_carterae.1
MVKTQGKPVEPITKIARLFLFIVIGSVVSIGLAHACCKKPTIDTATNKPDYKINSSKLEAGTKIAIPTSRQNKHWKRKSWNFLQPSPKTTKAIRNK